MGNHSCCVARDKAETKKYKVIRSKISFDTDKTSYIFKFINETIPESLEDEEQLDYTPNSANGTNKERAKISLDTTLKSRSHNSLEGPTSPTLMTTNATEISMNNEINDEMLLKSSDNLKEPLLTENSPRTSEKLEELRKSRANTSSLEEIKHEDNNTETTPKSLSYQMLALTGSASSIPDVLKTTVSLKELEANSEEKLRKTLSKIVQGDHVIECIDKFYPYFILPKSELRVRQNDENGHFIYGKMFKRLEAGGLEVIDAELLERQKNVVLHVLKNLGKNLIKGNGLLNLSLPIRIYGKESNLQRCCSGNVYAPIFLEPASRLTDYMEKFKQTVVFFFISLHTNINQEKPFNSLLGETYQGLIGNIPIYAEQVSVEPNVGFFYMKGKKYHVEGTFDVHASLGANSCEAVQKGYTKIKYDDGTEIIACFPSAYVSGTVIGARTFNFMKKLTVCDVKHRLYCEIEYNPQSDTGFLGGLFGKQASDIDNVEGKIWKVHGQFVDAFRWRKMPTLSEKYDVEEEICNVEGNWLSHLSFSDVKYWSIYEVRPLKLIDLPNKALPSDSTFRQDIIYRKLNEIEKAEDEKRVLEEMDQKDVKLREKLSTKHPLYE
jgi:hypothetical protein